MTERHELISAAMKAAEDASDVIVRLVSSRDNQIRFSDNQIDIAKSWTTTKMTVFVALGRRIGSTQIESPTLGAVRARTSELVSLTRTMRESPLFDGISRDSHNLPSMPDLLDPGIETFGEDAPRLIDQVIEASLEEGAERVAGSLIFGRDHIDIRTNHGGEGSYEHSMYELTVRSFLDPESSGQGLSCGRDLSRVEERFIKAGEDSGRIAAMAKGGSQGKPGSFDLIMSPTVAANLMGGLMEGANPLMIMLGYTPLKDRLGQSLGPDSLSVVDDPALQEGLGSRPFDDELVPTRKVKLFEEGRFVGVVHNTTSAKTHGAETTGSSHLASLAGSKIPMPWASNLVFAGGDGSPEDMIGDCSKPTIYVTSNWYTRFSNYVEGTFSTIPRDGIFLIEDGAIKRPIRKIRISENMIELLKRIECIADDVTQVHWWEVDTPTCIPHIKFRDVNITAATK
jgi:PmbA protein